MEDLRNFKKWNYASYSSDNYGAHAIAISLGSRVIYYSYDTIIAFNGHNSKGQYFNCISVTCWGNTTGKHLNCINPDKTIRLQRDEFERQLLEFMK